MAEIIVIIQKPISPNKGLKKEPITPPKNIENGTSIILRKMFINNTSF